MKSNVAIISSDGLDSKSSEVFKEALNLVGDGFADLTIGILARDGT